MCFSFSHLDISDSPSGVRRPSIRLRNLQENKILMEPLREFDTAINRAGVFSATAANQGVPPARAMAIAPNTKLPATGPISANGTKREASNRPSSEDNGGEKGNCKQVATGVHDQAGGGGGGSGSGEEGATQDPGLVSLRGVNFR